MFKRPIHLNPAGMSGSSRRQPLRLPPPLLHGPEALEAAVVLEEVSGDVGIVLWKSVRALRLRAAIPIEEREPAFSADAHSARCARVQGAAPPELRDPLLAVAEVLRPGPLDAPSVADACRRIADWADDHGALGTAVEFAQAAALTDPSEADHAQAAARFARRRAEYARAEMWYRTSIGVARGTGNWRVYARSHLGLGIVFVHRGNYPAAERAFLRTHRSARRHSIADLAAMALHELTVVAVRTRRVQRTVQFARAALKAYGPDDSRLPALAHDVAVLYMDRGYFAEALQVFTAIPADFGEPTDQLARECSIVRAAGAVGDRPAYEGAWRAAERLLDSAGAAPNAAGALIEMARGAEWIKDWDRAEGAAVRALALATERGEGERRLEAEAALEAIQHARRRHGGSALVAKRAPPPVQRFTTELADAVAAVAVGEQ